MSLDAKIKGLEVEVFDAIIDNQKQISELKKKNDELKNLARVVNPERYKKELGLKRKGK